MKQQKQLRREGEMPFRFTGGGVCDKCGKVLSWEDWRPYTKYLIKYFLQKEGWVVYRKNGDDCVICFDCRKRKNAAIKEKEDE